ncbi:cupin domain-containing protein [Actinomycetospora lutea]|uniref:cupin domain-containing protein n=1 Tax=Actinomycetospora lutea TaxID=663604 RepID=UPI00236689D9|nr:cupin domain-containing protein [Actinomycetospora lutea]MDD7938992.1 cupin domain-containing protein [Actinomycetospora lutea]
MSTTAPGPTSTTGSGLALDAVDAHLVVGPDDGYGGVSLVRISLAPHARTEPRRYDDADRLVIVLDGHTRVEVEGRPAVTLGPNEVLHVPRDTWHRVEALGGTSDQLGLGAAELLVLAADPQR